MVGIQGVDHVIGILQQIFEVLFRLLDLACPLPDLGLQLLAVLLKLLFQSLAFRNVAKLHHHGHRRAVFDSNQVHLSRHQRAVPMHHFDFLGGHLALPQHNLADQAVGHVMMSREHEFEESPADRLRLGVAKRLLLALIHRGDAAIRIDHEHGISRQIEQRFIPPLRQ